MVGVTSSAAETAIVAMVREGERMQFTPLTSDITLHIGTKGNNLVGYRAQLGALTVID
jgi:hypothetical protein